MILTKEPHYRVELTRHGLFFASKIRNRILGFSIQLTLNKSGEKLD